MKKILSLVLAVLIAFSALSVVSFAAGETVKVEFKNTGEVIYSKDIIIGEDDLTAFVPENPTKASDDTYEYLFKGWQLEGDTSGKLYQKNTIAEPTADDAGKTITYVAVYAENELPKNQTFWQLVQSIFARFNVILALISRFLGIED